MPDLSDQDLDALLAEMDMPAIPGDLTTSIMATLPPPRRRWHAQIQNLLGTPNLGLSAGGAFASLLFGLAAGYWLMPQAAVFDEREAVLELALETDRWADLIEEPAQ